MRKLTDGRTTIKVYAHITTVNMWEYYIMDPIPRKGKSAIVFALVMGFEQEIGSVDLDELAPYVISATTDLDELLPPNNWEWVDNG